MNRRGAETQSLKEPIISIDLRSKLIGIFDGFTMVRAFAPFTDEMQARMEATDWIVARGHDAAIRVVFLRIDRVRVSCWEYHLREWLQRYSRASEAKHVRSLVDKIKQARAA